ncbi:O-methyltransferase [Peribacillus simplex]|uniref:O-methyltransferase n=1 Tax=Peribacillus simplex TaxID=1478 RepID=UPI00119D0D51|nr:O-methyltransferase [Peribacillus simplex]
MSRKSSYENINYQIRPAKAIERKMLCDSFRRLNEFALIESYTYVGFGSTFFSDFILFHKTLGISEMISIEHDEEKEERFQFNVPFNCIDWIPGTSNDVLPTLDWSNKAIVWLDYDDSFNLEMLEDIKYLTSSLVSGSMLIISCNVHFPNGKRLEMMKEKLQEKMPEGLKEEDLDGWNVAKETRKIILSEIEKTLYEKNTLKPADKKYVFKQLFNFCYKDGAKMLTFGGIVHEVDEENKFQKCNFQNLSFVKDDERLYKIEIPSLTYKEKRYLDTQLPCEDIGRLKAYGVRDSDVKKYAEYYRYFPNFAETEI